MCNCLEFLGSDGRQSQSQTSILELFEICSRGKRRRARRDPSDSGSSRRSRHARGRRWVFFLYRVFLEIYNFMLRSNIHWIKGINFKSAINCILFMDSQILGVSTENIANEIPFGIFSMKFSPWALKKNFLLFIFFKCRFMGSRNSIMWISFFFYIHCSFNFHWCK